MPAIRPWWTDGARRQATNVRHSGRPPRDEHADVDCSGQRCGPGRYPDDVTDPQLAAAESLYLDARDAHDRAVIGDARGEGSPDLTATAEAAAGRARTALNALHANGDRRTNPAWSADDTRAYDVMREWIDGLNAAGAPAAVPGESWAATAERGLDALSVRIADEYGRAQSEVDIGDVTVTRLGVLDRLAAEPDSRRRRELFFALDPTWQTIDADGGVASPYLRMLPLSADRWSRRGSPVDRNAAALGISPADVEPQLVAILETWRDVIGATRVQPWDWWYEAGATTRALRAPVTRIHAISDAYHASLGADPRRLDVGFDLFPRGDRPLVPVAYTEFGGRPRRLPDGERVPARPWVMAAYTGGGLGELTELIHETGHAIHIAAIDTRPAFADWPDSDAFTEGLAELTALDTAEPTWQHRWLGASVPEQVAIHDRYADVALDVCWALFEIRMHADPDQVPNDVWTELTATYLGIAPHPEVSWWAMRGQLVQEPGYMVNYALGPIVAADLRAAIRHTRGDWVDGDPAWYEWLSDHVYRWGLERSSGAVFADVVGRPPTSDALLAEIRRARAR